MSTRYSISIRVPRDVRGELERIWRDNLTIEGSADDKFAWTYLDAPVSPEGVILLSAEAGDARRIVGSAGVLVRELEVAGSPVRAALLADLAVDRAHRRGFPAVRLVREARRYARGRFGLAYGFPNGRAAELFRRCGYRDLGVMIRYARVLRYRRYFSRAVRFPAAGAALGGVADCAALAGRAPAVASALARYRLAWTGEVGAEVDALWERLRGHYRVIAPRTAAFVRWRLFAHPEDRVELAMVTARDGGQARGWAAVELRDRVATVRDFFCHPDELAAVLERVALACRRRGAASLSLRFLGDPRVSSALARAGFSPREANRVVVYDAGDAVAGQVADPAAWFLTDADEDT